MSAASPRSYDHASAPLRSSQLPAGQAALRSRGSVAAHPGPRILLLHRYDDFAASVPSFQVAQRLGPITQFVGPVDDRCDLTGLHEARECAQVFPVELCKDRDEFLTGEMGDDPALERLPQPPEPMP